VFHYLSLHNSKYYADKHDGRDLPMTDRYSDCLIRLPMFYGIDAEMQDYIIDTILAF
jgi:dTDP-4-amino-4,6-dideoxygalactose transaminase